MTISQELNSIFEKQKMVISKVASDLFSELIKVTPVAQERGGSLKGAWDLQKSGDGWIISNNLLYASVIFEGRRFVYSPSYPNGRWEGSEQLKEGIDPILKKYNKIMENELKKVR